MTKKTHVFFFVFRHIADCTEPRFDPSPTRMELEYIICIMSLDQKVENDYRFRLFHMADVTTYKKKSAKFLPGSLF